MRISDQTAEQLISIPWRSLPLWSLLHYQPSPSYVGERTSLQWCCWETTYLQWIQTFQTQQRNLFKQVAVLQLFGQFKWTRWRTSRQTQGGRDSSLPPWRRTGTRSNQIFLFVGIFYTGSSTAGSRNENSLQSHASGTIPGTKYR